MGDIRPLKADYVKEGDFFSMWNGIPANGGGRNITTNTILTGFYAERDAHGCVGFDLFDAAKMLSPYLNGEVSKGTLYHGELLASYSRESDTLVLVSSQESVTHDEHIAEGLVAHCNESGWAVGFTLENAGELLSPHLNDR
jgi:uncharacterized protein YuzE